MAPEVIVKAMPDSAVTSVKRIPAAADTTDAALAALAAIPATATKDRAMRCGRLKAPSRRALSAPRSVRARGVRPRGHRAARELARAGTGSRPNRGRAR